MATRTLDYRDGAVNLKGYLATPDGTGARPGIVLFPEAFGIGEHVMERARRLAARDALDAARAQGARHAPRLVPRPRPPHRRAHRGASGPPREHGRGNLRNSSASSGLDGCSTWRSVTCGSIAIV